MDNVKILSIEKPEKISPRSIVYWSTSAKQLEGVKQGKAIISKAKKLVELGLVEENLDCSYTILPIPGYNKTIYTVKDGQCNCQFYCTVSKNWEVPNCSHIQAVKFLQEIKQWNGGVRW